MKRRAPRRGIAPQVRAILAADQVDAASVGQEMLRLGIGVQTIEIRGEPGGAPVFIGAARIVKKESINP